MELDLTFFDFIGILGSFLIAGAYFGITNQYLKSDHFNFHFINLIGSSFILISLYFKPNVGAIFIEVLWVFIACFGIFNFLKNKY